MRPSQIEGWTLEVVDRVLAGQPIEDDRIELKEKWPAEHAKAARRIAGHVNASRGETVLWIIGIKDRGDDRLVGADPIKFPDWWAQVARSFDELEPEHQVVNVPTGEGVTVVAVLIDGSRAPLVVKAAEGGSPEREVPWRAGTRIRSAKRSELLRILVPAARRPRLEVLDLQVWTSSKEIPGLNVDKRHRAHFRCELYLETTQQLVIPEYRCWLEIRNASGGDMLLAVPRVQLWVAGGSGLPSFGRLAPPPPEGTMRLAGKQLIANGPGHITCTGSHEQAEPLPLIPGSRLQVLLHLGVVGLDPAAEISIALRPIQGNLEHDGTWGPDSS